MMPLYAKLLNHVQFMYSVYISAQMTQNSVQMHYDGRERSGHLNLIQLQKITEYRNSFAKKIDDVFAEWKMIRSDGEVPKQLIDINPVTCLTLFLRQIRRRRTRS